MEKRKKNVSKEIWDRIQIYTGIYWDRIQTEYCIRLQFENSGPVKLKNEYDISGIKGEAS